MSNAMEGLRTRPWAQFALASLALIFLTGSATAQSGNSGADETLEPVYPSWTGSEDLQKTADQSWKTKAFTGFEYQGETGLDGPGDFKFWMVSGGVSSARMIGDNVKVALKGDYRAIGYDFGGLTGGVDPWETVHVLRLNPLMTYVISDAWSVIGGPIVEFSGEEEADFSDSLRGGGLVGFGYKRPSFYIAFGVLAMTEIEKDARIQPFILIDWKITDGLALGVKADTSRGGELRMDYALTRNLTMGVGVGVRRELFRLNNDGPGGGPGTREDGVGEETSATIKITAIYQINEMIAIEGYGGIVANGEFRLENENGDVLAQADYDNSGFGGMNMRFSF